MFVSENIGKLDCIVHSRVAWNGEGESNMAAREAIFAKSNT